MRVLTLFLILLSFLSLWAGSGLSWADWQKAGWIQAENLIECSGMDTSTTDEDLLWAVNDGGNGPFLFALGADGRDRGRVRILGAVNRDWEALATFRWKDRSMVLIADFGDNQQQHSTHTLYVLEEPQLEGETVSDSMAVPTKWRMIFSYPDGKHDAEGVAVDPIGGRVFILTKRDDPPILFGLPFDPPFGSTPVLAQKIATVEQIPQPTAEDLRYPYGHVRSQPTGMDLTADGLSMTILTYKHAYLYRRLSKRSWAATLGGPPIPIQLPLPQNNRDLKQREAVCFSASEASIYVTSEGRNAGLYRLQIVHTDGQ
jgi:hypothetical protein